MPDRRFWRGTSSRLAIVLLFVALQSPGCIAGPGSPCHGEDVVPAHPEWTDGEQTSSNLWQGHRQLPYTDEDFLAECRDQSKTQSKSGVKKVRISYHTGSVFTKIQVVSPVTRESLAEAKIVWPCVEWVNFTFEE